MTAETTNTLQMSWYNRPQNVGFRIQFIGKLRLSDLSAYKYEFIGGCLLAPRVADYVAMHVWEMKKYKMVRMKKKRSWPVSRHHIKIHMRREK